MDSLTISDSIHFLSLASSTSTSSSSSSQTTFKSTYQPHSPTLDPKFSSEPSSRPRPPQQLLGGASKDASDSSPTTTTTRGTSNLEGGATERRTVLHQVAKNGKSSIPLLSLKWEACETGESDGRKSESEDDHEQLRSEWDEGEVVRRGRVRSSTWGGR